MPFEFNIYSSLLLSPFIQAVIFSILLIVRYRNQERLSDALLAGILIVNAVKIAFWMLGFAGWYDSHDGYTSFMFYFPFNNMLLLGPLVYFYFLSLTNTHFSLKQIQPVHFILPGVYLLLIAGKAIIDFAFYYPFENIELTQYGTKGPWAELDKHAFVLILGYLSFGYYLYKTLVAFKAYRIYIQENFSSPHQISFSWLRNLIYVCGSGVITFFIFDLIALLQNGENFRFSWYAYAGLGIITYYLSIAGYSSYSSKWHQLTFLNEEEKHESEAIHHNLGSPQIEKQEPVVESLSEEMINWITKIRRKIEKDNLYLEPELTLSDLARHVATNPSYLSKIINNSTGQNFNDFINEYRVQAVIEKLKSGEQATQTLLGIAFDCGFNSKATFNRAFKKGTGVSPKLFLQELALQNS